ncbi:hypothetical protein M0638_10100 [Roseomonas sp. NAR14]|uniref:Bacterial transcriptional activator domain-containing protein n=1 Tax=Roseomonas acroporae TaxID=2937791 RepID=A0A9X1Y7S1_9PROT|nr:hypothetical protein [Roseomonas acroporae]MCK8784733.1 hypothetical protein [Roseomonas acroporae]
MHIGPASIACSAVTSARFGAAPPKGQETRLHLALLGEMQARDAAGRSVLPRGRKARALLAILAIEGARVPRDRLTGLLWSRRGRAQARGSLRQAVHELQGALARLGGGLLLAERDHLGLAAAAVAVDVRALATVDFAQPVLPSGLDAPLLGDLVGLDPAFEEWREAEQDRLRAGLASHAEMAAGEGKAPEAVLAVAERLLGRDPGLEPAWRAALGVHLGRGERDAATVVARRCRVALQEVGRRPDAATAALLDRLLPRDEPYMLEGGRAGRDGRPTLGVLPFRCLPGSSPAGGPAGEPGQDEGLGEGLAEEITTALSRFRWISLVPGAALAPLALAPPGDPAWMRLGLDLLLTGMVQRSESGLRVTVRLLDLRAGGAVVWTRRFDRPDGDPLAVQDAVAAATAAQLDPELLLHEARRAEAGLAGSGAWSLLLRAIAAVYRLDQGRERYVEAGSLFAAAVAADPTCGAAHAWWAYWHLLLVGQGWAADPARSMREAGALAERGIMLDPLDARATTIAGHVYAFLGHRVAEAIALHQRALVQNPNLPLAWVFSGFALSYAGEHEEALRRIRHGRALSPDDPHSFFFEHAEMLPLLLSGDHAGVVALGRQALLLNPNLSSTLKGYLAACGLAGLPEEAARVRERLLALEPGFGVGEALRRSALQRDEDLDLYARGLRLAGLPD